MKDSAPLPIGLGQIMRASFMGIAITWMGYAIWAVVEATRGPSHDIAQALLPAVLAMSALFALLIFWPLTIVLARIGIGLMDTQAWARAWWGWVAVGALTGTLTLTAVMALISGGSAELGAVAIIGGLFGAAVAGITYRRLDR